MVVSFLSPSRGFRVAPPAPVAPSTWMFVEELKPHLEELGYGTSPMAITRLQGKGLPRAEKHGRRLAFPRAAILAWLAAKKQPANSVAVAG
jgi:hypothetical protein